MTECEEKPAAILVVTESKHEQLEKIHAKIEAALKRLDELLGEEPQP